MTPAMADTLRRVRRVLDANPGANGPWLDVMANFVASEILLGSLSLEEFQLAMSLKEEA